MEQLKPPLLTDTATALVKDNAFLATRMLWYEFPELRDTLASADRKVAFIAVMMSAFQEAANNVSEHLVETHTPKNRNRYDTLNRRLHPESHIGQLLMVYAEEYRDSNKGLSSTEAYRLSSLPPESCYWKRINELLQLGYLEPWLKSDGTTLRRQLSGTGRTRVQRVCRITEAGLDLVVSWEQERV